MLVPRDRLQSLTKSGADPWAMTTVVQDTFRKYPKDVGVRRHLLQFMDKILDARRPVSVTRSWGPTETASWKTLSMTILTVAWNLEDIPLYCKAVRSCTAEGDVPSDLIAELATLINKSLSTPQPWDWDKWYVYHGSSRLRLPLNSTNNDISHVASENSSTALSILLSFSQRSAMSRRRLKRRISRTPSGHGLH